MDHDYEKLDKEIRYSYKADRLEQAKKFGYEYITQCLVEEYRKEKSLLKVADKLGLTLMGVSYALKKIGEPIGQRGGARNNLKGRQPWNPLMTNTSSYESNPDYKPFG